MCSAICRQVLNPLVFVLSCVVLSRIVAVHTDIMVYCVVLCNIAQSVSCLIVLC